MIEKITSIAEKHKSEPVTYNERNFIPDYNNNYYWDLYYFGRHIGDFSNTISGDKVTHYSNVDGYAASIWDVRSIGQINVYESHDRINRQRTRLDVNWSSQTLLDWGPNGSDKSGSVTVELSAAGPTASWTMDLAKSSVSDLSVKKDKYGRWEFNAPFFGSVKSLLTKPGIRASNTTGNFAINVSHTFELNNGDHGTGVVGVYWADR